ncbi:Sulfite exporter TauE/SafE [Oligella ureolytica]|uniref:Probable membrane transporter protein n=1 Tax=Oligella ureolytica TaxID=90244 RepID=A0A378XHS0_9BURK|nr:TSUP family transporter [Oligella ureolytica]QPT39743.1 TSUP family transporter [Oligella ureolytica]SUA57398.1 Sulfite exporter TauE/SafE [Oligella ureolytica]
MDFVLSWEMLLILFGIAMLAGFIDTLAGGGGLITVPVLLLSGLPPIQALATNKIQSSFGTMVATLNMFRGRLIKLENIRLPFIMSLIGAALGTLLVQQLNVAVLDIVIPIVLVLIGLYFLLVKGAGAVERKPRMAEKPFNTTVVLVIGFYDGLFGPGTGSFFSLANVALRGEKIVQATAKAKAFNFASNIASAVVFMLGGKVVWSVGVAMMLGQVIGATIGSKVMVSHGARLIRPIIVAVCFLMVIRYLWDKF